MTATKKGHRYMSKAWRKAYATTLTPAEFKLIQGLRGVDREMRELLCETMKELVIGPRGPRASVIVALRRALRTVGKDATADIENLKAWGRAADIAARNGLPVQIPGGVR